MTCFTSLPDDAGVRHILALNPQAGRALIGFHTAVMRQDTALTALHKELLAVHVSGLNACACCHGVKGHETPYRDRGAALARDGYAPLLAYLPDFGSTDGSERRG